MAAASSILIGICCRIATEERIVYGSRPDYEGDNHDQHGTA